MVRPNDASALRPSETSEHKPASVGTLAWARDSGGGTEAHLLHEGAALDVIGARFDEVAPTTRNEVLRAHPRLEMKNSLVAAMKRQSNIRPHSRAGVVCDHGFVAMIRRARF
jgi:hypothetical protein